MRMTLCTLFNSLYLDKGLVLYDSLLENSGDFMLYVLCMDEKCYEVLTHLNLQFLSPIRLVDFEDEELLKIKKTRSLGEYCWTCSSSLIRYILQTYDTEYCTYVDADMYFYSDPSVVIDEMKMKGASVQVVGHRFNKYDAKHRSHILGTYCVEFNTFKNDENGLKLLNRWRNQCLEYCKIDGDGVHWADQKYLDGWCDKYSYCIETQNLGMGIAPWNIAQYKLMSNSPSLVVFSHNKAYQVVFYHFENIEYLSENVVKMNVFKEWNVDKDLVEVLYRPYLSKIREKKTILKEKYGIDILLKTHPGVDVKGINLLFLFAQKIKKIGTFNTWINFLLHTLPTKINKRQDILKLS